MRSTWTRCSGRSPITRSARRARPALAQALVAAGHVRDTATAFEWLIGEGCPAFVTRRGAPPARVVQMIGAAGGVAALAHPALARDDALVPALASQGLRALEVYHRDHDPAAVERYLALASHLDLVATGGSDFHGDPRDSRAALGQVTMPEAELVRLRERVPRWH